MGMINVETVDIISVTVSVEMFGYTVMFEAGLSYYPAEQGSKFYSGMKEDVEFGEWSVSSIDGELGHNVQRYMLDLFNEVVGDHNVLRELKADVLLEIDNQRQEWDGE